jgi:energy-coupling factor transport system permease protein
MNQFEYLQRAVIGQYYPGDSLIHRLDPRTRIVAYTLVLLAVTVAVNIPAVLAVILLVLLTLVLAHIPVRYALRSLLPPLPFLMILAVLQIFLSPTQSADNRILFELGPLQATTAGLLSAMQLLAKFSALILLIGLSSFTISSSELIHGLRSLLAPLARLKLPVQDLVLTIQVMLRFIPFLAISAERIAKAQAARGATWGTGRGNLVARVREVAPLIVPLFLTSLRRAENLALAMDARAYGLKPNRTSLVELEYHSRDFLVMALAALVAVGIFLAGRFP